MTSLRPLQDLNPRRFDTPEVLKCLNQASRALAELKGIAATIPNQGILISTLAIQEAKDSSAIENIVTTHDELFREDAIASGPGLPAAKEVLRYRQALSTGYELVRRTGLLTTSHIVAIQAKLERNDAGLRKLPGTVLKDSAGRTVYTPPQEATEVVRLMGELEKFLNDDPPFDVDPLIRMALIHHQFESIHPFYDGNGRTGRIVNVLYLVKSGLLDIPILYLSRHIVRTKPTYYRLLQDVREHDLWEDWVCYLLTAIEKTAAETIRTIKAIRAALDDYRTRIREGHRFYSQDLVHNLFMHPYTKIEFVVHDLGVSRLTAARYLEELAAAGYLRKQRIGRSNYFLNVALTEIFAGLEDRNPPTA